MPYKFAAIPYPMKWLLFAAFIALSAFSIYFIVFEDDDFASTGIYPPENENVTLIEPPDDDLIQILPCFMDYGDETILGDGRQINISIYAGPASTWQDAVRKPRQNRESLIKTYETIEHVRTWDQYLGWSDNILIKYRTEKHLYPRNGWYINAFGDEGRVLGSFYLSDDGRLMAARQTCTVFNCCV